MSEAKRQTSWTWEAYLDWEARKTIRYESVHIVDREQIMTRKVLHCTVRRTTPKEHLNHPRLGKHR